MNISVRKQNAIPLLLVIVLFLFWIAPGIVGRDLWKADEPYSFGIVRHIAATGDWVVPSIAGEPFMEKPPLFYLTSAGFMKLFSPWLQPHDAARLASVFYLALTMLFTGLAARELLGSDYIGVTLIILIGSTGLQVSSHKLITDNALIAGMSVAIYGLSLCGRRPVSGGFWLGTGAGVGFMAKGLLVPGILALTVAVLIVGFQSWRRTISLTVRLAAYGAVLPWIIIWPLALYMRSPSLFKEWFFFQNLGRFFGVSFVGQTFDYFYYFVHLTWFALPSLPIVLWAVGQGKGVWRERTGLQLPIVLFLVTITVLSASSGKRDLYLLPALLPLSLLAAGVVGSLPERAALFLNRISLGLFGMLATVLWIVWIINLSGSPVFLAPGLRHMQPDYTPTFSGPFFALACIYTILWIFVIARSSHYARFYLLNWTAGVVLIWGLLMTIWLPWLDAGSSFRPQFMSLKEHIPGQCRSVMTLGLGESENALLEYYAGVKPRSVIMEQTEHAMIVGVTKGNGLKGSFRSNNSLSCDWLLTQNITALKEIPDEADWKPLYEVRRPIDPAARPKEIFTLFTRNRGKKLCN